MALLGWGDYLCEACRHFDTDGNDGNHPFCRKQSGIVWGEDATVAIPLGKDCPYGYEFGVPTGYRGTLDRREERASEIHAKMGNHAKKENQE